MNIKLSLRLLTTAGGALYCVLSAEAGDAIHYTGEVFTVANSYCPQGTLEANGQILNKSDYTALFDLVGNTFGGNGSSTFALPDLRGRNVIGAGNMQGGQDFDLGQSGGDEKAGLGAHNLPPHNHTSPPHTHNIPEHRHDAYIKPSTNAGTEASPVDNSFPTLPSGSFYAAGDPDGSLGMNAGTINIDMGGGGSVENTTVTMDEDGVGAPFDIRSPYLVLRYCVVTDGVTPKRN